MASLPPMLLARLKKRGIVREPGEDEEVFAESYDKDGDGEQKDAEEKYRGGAPGCPNKWNQYHICTEFCFDHWQEGYPEHRLPDKYLDQRKKMLRDYPLPPGWKEVYDSGMFRHYYWNTNTDEVCWVSPRHPKAVISEAAPKLAKEMAGSGIVPLPSDYDERRGQRRDRGDRDRERGERGGRRDGDRRDERRDRVERRRERDSGGRELERRRRRGSGSGGSDGGGSGEEGASRALEISDRERLKRAKRRGLDPMDPAAYGDVDTGSWSSGLVADTKTGADVTAAGPLFQQRPYPAPGAILRRNNPNADKEKGNE